MAWSVSPNTILTTSERLSLHGGCLFLVLLTTWRLRRAPVYRGRVALARPAFLVLTLMLWLILFSAGVSTHKGFMGGDTLGYGSFPLATQSALVLSAPLLLWSLLHRSWSWMRSRGERPVPASVPRPGKKAVGDGGGREERAVEGRIDTERLAIQGVLGAMGSLAFWAAIGALEASRGAPATGLLGILTGLPI